MSSSPPPSMPTPSSTAVQPTETSQQQNPSAPSPQQASPPPPSTTTSAAPRADMIYSAVKFLQDPKVSTSSLAKKISFLESKGLTTAEIEAAVAQVSQAQTGHTSATGMQQMVQVPQSQMQALPPTMPQVMGPSPGYVLAKSSRYGSSWKDWVLGVAFITALGYSSVLFIKKYFPTILTYFKSSPTPEQDTRVLKLVEEKLQQVDELTRMVKAQKVDERRQRDELTDIRSELRALSTQRHTMNEIMSELTRVKGILLNQRHNLENGTSWGKPRIPSWQRQPSPPASQSANTSTASGVTNDISAEKEKDDRVDSATEAQGIVSNGMQVPQVVAQ